MQKDQKKFKKNGTRLCITISFMFTMFFAMMLVYLPVPLTKNMEKGVNNLVVIKQF